MALDRYQIATGNLRADRWQEMERSRKQWENLKLKLGLVFFQRHPSPKPTVMNLTDFNREHPEFPVHTVTGMKGVRTMLKKKGLLLIPLLLLLSSCASLTQKPGIASIGTRTGQTIDHGIVFLADLASLHLSTLAVLSLATPFGTAYLLPVTFYHAPTK